MRKYRAGILPIMLLASGLMPLADYYFQGLAALPLILKLTAAIVVLVTSTAALAMVSAQWAASALTRHVLCGALIALGAALGLSNPGGTPVGSVYLGYSDGSNAELHATAQDIEGHALAVYGMHPAFGAAKVPDTLAGALPHRTFGLRVYLYKPPGALHGPDGSTLPSDGISADIQTLDRHGAVIENRSFNVPQAQFLADPLVVEEFHAGSGIAAVKVHIGTGPPGSTPDNDTTLVALEASDSSHLFFNVGRGQFCVLLLFGLASWVRMALRAGERPGSAGTRESFRSTFAIAAVLLCAILLLLALGSANHASFVYFWDYRNYWEKAETLFGLAHDGHWQQAVAAVLNSLPSDYSLTPAVFPALVATVAGGPSLNVYLSSVIVIYAVPAYLMVALLAARLQPASARPRSAGLAPLLLCLGAILLSLPVFFGAIVYLRPDIGGVSLLVMALLVTDVLTRELGRAPEIGNQWASVRLLRSSLAIGLLFGLIFLFRRWYAFGVAGIAAAGALVLVIEFFRSTHRMWILRRTCLAVALTLFTMLPLLAPVLFDWSANLGKHDYSTLYASYKNPIWTDFQGLILTFGWGAVGVAAAFVIFGRLISSAQRLWFILVVSSLISVLLFARVQSPGLHHFYLLMPLFGASIGVASLAISARKGVAVSALLVAVLAAGNVASTWLPSAPQAVRLVFPGYSDWLPRINPYLAGLRTVAGLATTPHNAQKKVCVIASSLQINQDIFKELWQIDPPLRKTLSPRIIDLGQVDSVNGPPVEALRLCELMLVATPFQSHLRPGEQMTVQVVQEDLVAGTGIGAAFGPPTAQVAISADIQMLVYERRREITDAEYADLVQRYLKAKGDSASLRPQ